MKKLGLLIVLVLCPCLAFAAPFAENFFYDSNQGLYWYKGMDDFGNMTYYEQLNQVAEMRDVDALGYSGWRLATSSEWRSLFNGYTEEYLLDNFLLDLPRYESALNTSGRAISPIWAEGYWVEDWDIYEVWYSAESGIVYNFFTDSRLEPYTYRGEEVMAWVVADAAPAPIPASIFLLGSGLVAVATRRKGKQKGRE